MKTCLCGKPAKREHRNRPWCPECWKGAFVVRAVTIPVAGPVSCDWPTLRLALKACWSASTRVANYTIRLLAQRDIVRTPEMKKLPPMPKMPTAGPKALYGLARAFAPEIDSGTAACLTRKIEANYKEYRFDVVWRSARALPSFKYPFPYPVPNQRWSLAVDPGGAMLLTLPLGGESRVLRLRGGHEFVRQRKMLEQIIAGEAIQGELCVLEQVANGSDHRPSVDGKGASRLMIKVVGWFPRSPAKERVGSLIVTTSKDSLLVALNGKNERLFNIHADHVKRWSIAHKAQLQRWSDDTKREIRRPVPFSRRRELSCDKFDRRMKTAIDQIAAQLVHYADRQKFASIEWTPTEERFLESFQWSKLEIAIEQRCDALGIHFEKKEVSVETRDPQTV